MRAFYPFGPPEFPYFLIAQPVINDFMNPN